MNRKTFIYASVAMLLVLWVLGFNPAAFAAPILIGNVTGLQERAALIQRDMADTVMEFRPSRARTLSTFEEGGARKKDASMTGLQIPYWKDRANGQMLYNPVTGSNSFRKSTKQNTGAMYVGVVYRNMNIWLEYHVLREMNKGKIPDSYLKERRRRISTHMWKKNKAAIGDGTGALATVSSAAVATITCLADNSARGTSKGAYFLQPSTSADPLYYDCVNPATGAVVATFYVTSTTATTAVVAGFTVGNIAACNNAGYKICESGFWNLEMQGLAAHISDSTSRIYQGADVSVDTFLQNPSVDAGNVAVTPTALHTAKGIMMTRCNQAEGELPFVAHITPENLRTLAKFGYTLRNYNAEGGKASTTYGLPNVFVDDNVAFVEDADYEDCYIDLRERNTFFEYVLEEFHLKTADGVSRHEYIGANSVGSTNEYENYIEAVNIVWDSRGKDGSQPEGSNPNTSVFIKNIALPAVRQNVYGV